MKKIDLIVPCYNEEESIPLFYEEITNPYLCNHKLAYQQNIYGVKNTYNIDVRMLVRNHLDS